MYRDNRWKAALDDRNKGLKAEPVKGEGGRTGLRMYRFCGVLWKKQKPARRRKKVKINEV